MIASPLIPNKEGKATDSMFALIGAHQCGILMDVLGWQAVGMAASTRLVVSTETAKEATVYGLMLG